MPVWGGTDGAVPSTRQVYVYWGNSPTTPRFNRGGMPPIGRFFNSVSKMRNAQSSMNKGVCVILAFAGIGDALRNLRNDR